MELRQRTELRRLLVPELNQSLKILALPLLDLKSVIEAELTNNPFLEETPPAVTKPKLSETLPYQSSGLIGPDTDFRMNLISKKVSLQDILLRQLGMFANTDEEFKIGQEIIGNIDGNGYLKVTLEEISKNLNLPLESAEKVLKLIQQFEPAGVAARTVSECLLIQLALANEKEPLLRKIVECHLEDVAKKNYSLIAKALNEPLEKIEPLIKKVSRFDPKPGRNYSTEEIRHVVPDIIIDEKGDELDISINDEDIPTLNINKDYKKMLKDKTLDPQTKEYLTNQLKNALALLRAVFRRKSTLRRIVETIVEIQQDAIKTDFSHLKPLVFQEVANKLSIHESTVCRAIMNKYVRLPFGVVALKDFFSSRVQDSNGQSLSSKHVLRLIKELIEQEDKKHPLSDQEISNILSKQHNLSVPRRTVTKYREELKILSSTYRRER
jgi:RNA polymerase sigma-54 factor